MTVITLPPEIEAPLAAEARRRGMDVEALAIESLREKFPAAVEPPGSLTLYDRLKDYVGIVKGSGEVSARDSGRAFADMLMEKHKRGNL